MGEIKKLGTLENQQKLQEALREATERMATAQGNYNSTVKQMTEEQTAEICQAIEEAVERMVTAQGTYNGTVKRIADNVDELRASIADIYAATVTRQE